MFDLFKYMRVSRRQIEDTKDSPVLEMQAEQFRVVFGDDWKFADCYVFETDWVFDHRKRKKVKYPDGIPRRRKHSGQRI